MAAARAPGSTSLLLLLLTILAAAAAPCAFAQQLALSRPEGDCLAPALTSLTSSYNFFPSTYQLQSIQAANPGASSTGLETKVCVVRGASSSRRRLPRCVWNVPRHLSGQHTQLWDAHAPHSCPVVNCRAGEVCLGLQRHLLWHLQGKRGTAQRQQQQQRSSQACQLAVRSAASTHTHPNSHPQTRLPCAQIVNNSRAGELYLLYQCGTPNPQTANTELDLPPGTKVFEVPLVSVAVTDTNPAGFLVSYFDHTPAHALLAASVCSTRNRTTGWRATQGCGAPRRSQHVLLSVSPPSFLAGRAGSDRPRGLCQQVLRQPLPAGNQR